jgi:chitodextrinase
MRALAWGVALLVGSVAGAAQRPAPPGKAGPPAAKAPAKLCPKCRKPFAAAVSFCTADGARLYPPPALPPGVRAEPRAGQVALTWGAVTPGSSVVVERRGGDPKEAFKVLGQVAEGTGGFVDPTVRPDTPYHYRVQVVNPVGRTPHSAPLLVRTAPLAPQPPSGLEARAGENQRVELKWAAGAGPPVTEYRLERQAPGGQFTEIARAQPATLAFTDSGLAPETVYRYRVLAVNGGGTSGYSNEALVTTLPPPPGAPQHLTALPLCVKAIRLDWAEFAADETELQVQRRTAGADFQTVATLAPNSNTYVDFAVNNQAVYTYRVRARGAGGVGAFSSEVAVTTATAPDALPEWEPNQPELRSQVFPNAVEFGPTGGTRLEMLFEYGAYKAKITRRTWRYFLPDGTPAAPRGGPLAMNLELPGGEPYRWKDSTGMDAAAYRFAVGKGADTLLLRHYFEGVREDGQKLYWSNSLTIKLKPQ